VSYLCTVQSSLKEREHSTETKERQIQELRERLDETNNANKQEFEKKASVIVGIITISMLAMLIMYQQNA